MALLLASLALSLSSPYSRAFAEGAGVRLEWTAVEGARSYLVEIRAPGGAGLVLSATAVEPRIEAPLVPGDYEIRVSALNVFGKAVAVGEWTAFSVRATARLEEPSLASPPEADPSNPALIVIRIHVSGAMPDTVARLEGQDVRIEATRVEPGEAGLEVAFDLAGAPAGDYDLVLENPGGYSARIDGAVRVAAPEPEPEPEQEPQPEPEPGPGTGTEPEPEPEPESASGTELEAEPEPAAGTEPEPGPESALGTEPEPESVPEAVAGTEPEPALAMAEPSPVPDPETEPMAQPEADAVAVEPGRDSVPRRPRDPLPLRYEVLVGWRPAIALDADWGGSYGFGWAGAELALGLRLAEPAPAWLRVFSVELGATGFRLPGITGAFIESAETLAMAASLELGASWRPAVWLELALRGGGALFVTHVTRTGMIGDFDEWSLGDPAAQGSLSTRFILGRFLVETGCAWQHVFYIDVPADFLRPFLRFGWSFGR